MRVSDLRIYCSLVRIYIAAAAVRLRDGPILYPIGKAETLAIARVTGVSGGSSGADGTLAAGAASTAVKGRPTTAQIFAVIARTRFGKHTRSWSSDGRPHGISGTTSSSSPFQHPLRNARLGSAEAAGSKGVGPRTTYQHQPHGSRYRSQHLLEKCAIDVVNPPSATRLLRRRS